MEKKQLPVGRDNFEDIIRKGLYYVDKTNLINEMFANESGVYLFTRPRRFGKSLNISMLKHFFSIDGDRSLFDGLKISKNKELCEKYQNKHPVISLTLKSVQGDNYIFARNMFQATVCDEIRKFYFLLESSKLDETDKESYKSLIKFNKTDKAMDAPIYEMNDSLLGKSLLILSQLLYKHYEVKPIILIDEYDVPLAQAFYNNYYDKMITLVRSFFDNGLKTNDNIEFAVLTGCLRISRESIFTGMNNLKVFTVSQEKFSTCFGFTENEVKDLLNYYDRGNRYEDAKKWYDGFNIGNNAMFSPWDVICFAQDIRNNETAKAESYWTETSSNHIIRTLLEKASEKETIDKVSDELETLVSGGTVAKNIVQALTYKDLYDSVDNIWSVMLSTGYLTIKDQDKKGNLILAIPNYEIKRVYIEKIQEWTKTVWNQESQNLNSLARAFLSGEPEKAQSILNNYTSTTIGLRDSMRQKDSKESFYHGIILGMLSNEGKSGYTVKSNREAGKGYLDICILSKDMKTGAILEIKLAKKDDDYDNACNKALEQIEKRNYTKIFRPIVTKTVYKYGIACRHKFCQIRQGETEIRS